MLGDVLFIIYRQLRHNSLINMFSFYFSKPGYNFQVKKKQTFQNWLLLRCSMDSLTPSALALISRLKYWWTGAWRLSWWVHYNAITSSHPLLHLGFKSPKLPKRTRDEFDRRTEIVLNSLFMAMGADWIKFSSIRDVSHLFLATKTHNYFLVCHICTDYFRKGKKQQNQGFIEYW
jgi:hypothetical protein